MVGVRLRQRVLLKGDLYASAVQVFDSTTLTLITTSPADKGAHNVTYCPIPTRTKRPLSTFTVCTVPSY